ncbi:polyamine ABC transporter permease [Pandoraea eparura]|uniref:Polyamine ABC transporter permease n=1 Tax=Pandoraea eparura TaxID=2508291 RepID=A0A5E4RBD6_9BURK|nr:ABC transporter permease [Pandoraea eparura]VVD60686.1 polyamine ABC transporter permease [Pandoraea eparura]
MQIDWRAAAVLLAIPLLFLLAFFAVPFAVVMVDSLSAGDGGFGVSQYAKLLSDWYYFDVLWFTLRVSLWVTLVSFVIGYVLAYVMTRMVQRRWLRRLLYIAVITPLFTSNIVRSFGWMIILGREGLVNQSLLLGGIIDRPLALLNSELSIVIGMSYIMTPFMVLTIAAVLQNIDRTLEHAAQDLGATPVVSFLKVTFPLSMPGVIAGSLIVFTLSVSAYVTPSILSGGKKTVMSMLIYQQYASIFDFHFGAALAVALLLTTLVLLALSSIASSLRPGKRKLLGATV